MSAAFNLKLERVTVHSNGSVVYIYDPKAERADRLVKVRSNALTKTGQWSPTVGSFVASAVTS